MVVADGIAKMENRWLSGIHEERHCEQRTRKWVMNRAPFPDLLNALVDIWRGVIILIEDYPEGRSSICNLIYFSFFLLF